ncbi:hypothetical protein ACIA8R_51770 [Nonomuraea sp. NPDC051191]|uniref:hypothetical protein n=1 Tax=Nonomuraea sp. NPDC051191 TaxID=3364372 RepID=UPI0037BC4FB4
MPLTDPDGHKTTKPKKTQYDKCRKNLNKKGFEKCVFGTKKTTQQCEKDAVHRCVRSIGTTATDAMAPTRFTRSAGPAGHDAPPASKEMSCT